MANCTRSGVRSDDTCTGVRSDDTHSGELYPFGYEERSFHIAKTNPLEIGGLFTYLLLVDFDKVHVFSYRCDIFFHIGFYSVCMVCSIVDDAVTIVYAINTKIQDSTQNIHKQHR